jgi:hypothetical protein
MPISEVASEIASLAARLSSGEVQAFRTLTVVPLLDPAAPTADHKHRTPSRPRGSHRDYRQPSVAYSVYNGPSKAFSKSALLV